MTQRRVAFVFPGQGSQKPGMGKNLYEQFPAAKAVFDEANEALGFDLTSICFDGPEETLRSTENAQPALFTTSIAAFRAFESTGPILAQAAAGHSVGEYAALTASGSLDFRDGVRLVRKRGELMQDAAKQRPGTMCALLGIEAEAARVACDRARTEGAGIVAVANYNGGGQVVISGETDAVHRAGEVAKELGARKVVPLAVSGAFHSPIMVMAGDALYKSLAVTAFRKPTIPVITNVEARFIEVPGDIVAGLTMQISGSVRWEESMQALVRDGINTMIEFGSGEVLCGLMKRIDKTVQTAAVQDAARVASARALFESEVEN